MFFLDCCCDDENLRSVNVRIIIELSFDRVGVSFKIQGDRDTSHRNASNVLRTMGEMISLAIFCLLGIYFDFIYLCLKKRYSTFYIFVTHKHDDTKKNILDDTRAS